MKLHCRSSRLQGSVEIPGSKSHTIRAVAIAALAEGDSVIREPLLSADTRAVIDAYSALGATIEQGPGLWRIQGTGGHLQAPSGPIDVGNSGTTLRIAMGSCALLREGTAILTGDEQIQRRPAGPLAQSLTDLGANAISQRGDGCAPFEISGTLRGGETSIEAVTSQYLSSLLMSTPLAEGDSTIHVPLLNERPYVLITLDWLARQGIRIEHNDDLSEFHVPGGQSFAPVDRRIPGDFSSATFFLCAGALAGNDIVCRGLDYADTQGDKAVVEYLRQMGAEVTVEEDEIRVKAATLSGCELDLNATPDALPMMAVLGCFAEGETRLVNVPQARMKETDRIAVMREELEKLGADVEELEDGLIVRESTLRGATVDGHADHRVVMALAIAATHIDGETIVEGAEAMDVTYPGFTEALAGLGGEVPCVDAAPREVGAGGGRTP
ncbi:MAG: 3-phosphoshikimate 1-carboxyvinyltransferase [Candidatus Hydrogenedentes bacterium]|nr:3-phosphoshikimate 1-carboxyvinyltransferase [Candidatus Hydrogenedentota bacterium]